MSQQAKLQGFSHK